MKTYFVCADIHGFYDEWMDDLSFAKFDVKNPDHILIVLGDIFDRGPRPDKVLQFLLDLPRERRILIRGNHERLLLDLVFRRSPFSYDISNGTYDTLQAFCVEDVNSQIEAFQEAHPYPVGQPNLIPSWREKNRLFFDCIEDILYKNEAINKVVDFLTSDDWVYYFETPHYIFVHAFIPLIQGAERDFYDPNWREASESRWNDATWLCPWSKYKDGCFEEEEKKGKKLVVGHWHTSDFYNNLDYKGMPEMRLPQRINPIYRSEKYPGLIGLDACTVLSHRVNVLVIREDEL